MTQHSWWRRIGGPNAVTVWSWWVSLPLALVASLYGGLVAGLPLVPWLTAALAVNVILIMPLVVIRTTYLSSRPRASRPISALITFAALGAMRSVLMVGVAATMGYADVGTILWEWPFMGAIAGALALSVIAVVVDSVRERRATMDRLRALQDSLRQIGEIESARLAGLEADFLRDVEDQVVAALEQVRASKPETGEQAGRSLREVSEAVVRPLSHQLAESESWRVPISGPPREGWTRRLADLVQLICPVPPLMPVLVVELTVLPFILAREGPALALLNLALGSMVLIGLGEVIRRAWRAARLPWLNVLGLGVCYAATFVIAGFLVSGAFVLFGGAPLPFWNVVFIYPILVLAWALLDAILARRAELEQELAESLAREAQATERLLARVTAMRRRLAKVLHSVVQGELVTSAVGLAQTNNPAAVSAEIDRVSASVIQRLRAAELRVDARERILDLVSLWSAALAVELDVDDDVWRQFDQNGDLQQSVVDVLAEGLTNAVRHGSGPHVRVIMRKGRVGLDVLIQSQGDLLEKEHSGLGMRTIATSAQAWSLEAKAGLVHLSVTLPS